MSNPLSRWFRRPAVIAPPPASAQAISGRTGSAAVVVAALAAAVAPGLAVAPAGAAPNDPAGRCAGFSAAAAGDLVTLRVLDLRPLGLTVPPSGHRPQETYRQLRSRCGPTAGRRWPTGG